MLEEDKFEKVTLKMPRGLIQLLRDFTENPEAWMEETIIKIVECELDSHIPEEGTLICKASILRKYGLNQVFKDLKR